MAYRRTHAWRSLSLHCGAALFCALALSSATAAQPAPKSGLEFTGADIRAMQADDFANPGMLWVTRGQKLWSMPAGTSGKTCVDCHGNAEQSMKGVATRYPLIDPGSARLVNIEGRVNLCRTRHQQAEAFTLESEDGLGLSAYVAHQSRGMPMQATLDAQHQRRFERGRAQYFKRIGQMNLACTHCHDRNWGRTLLAQTISQGHSNAYPAYRLEWQTVGSLQRRLRACYFGVRAEVPAYGADELLDLELYLAWRGSGLMIEAPGVRR